MPSTDTLIARIALSLWTSERRVERLPVVTTYSQHEYVQIVPCPVITRGTAWACATIDREGI